jgi:hypothetical protein
MAKWDSVKVTTLDEVRAHVINGGGSIGQFYDIAVREKIQRDTAVAEVAKWMTPDDIAAILDRIRKD